MSAFDKVVAASMKHERLIAIIGGAWFALSCASYANFIDLPQIPFITDEAAVFVSGGVNALWWGFLRPAIERRKQALLAERAVNG